MKRILRNVLYSIAITQALGHSLVVAQNFLPNPGFETMSACPTGAAQIANATPWFTPSGHGGSADFLHACATSTICDVPSNAFGNQAAHSGNGYLGFALFYISTPNFREYAQVQLTSALVAGQTYRWSSWVSLADNSSYTTDDLQFYFTASAVTWGGGGWGPMTTYTPQAAIPSGTLINDKANWMQISATYTAAGGERYMTMGNFLTDANTTMIYHSAGSYNTGYIYFDDMTLVPEVILSAELSNLSAATEASKVRLSWQTLSEVNTARFEIERSTDEMQSWQSIGQVEALGHSAEQKGYSYLDQNAIGGIDNHYRLKAVDLNGEWQYSHAVTATPHIEDDFLEAIHPNPVPAGHSVETMFISVGYQNVEVELMDMAGRIVLREQKACQPGNNNIHVPTHDLQPGNYLLRIRGGTELRIQRLSVL